MRPRGRGGGACELPCAPPGVLCADCGLAACGACFAVSSSKFTCTRMSSDAISLSSTFSMSLSPTSASTAPDDIISPELLYIARILYLPGFGRQISKLPSAFTCPAELLCPPLACITCTNTFFAPSGMPDTFPASRTIGVRTMRISTPETSVPGPTMTRVPAFSSTVPG